jgi:adenosine deaminase
MTRTIDPFIAGLPKAELHMHIEGSIEPELMFELAQRNGVKLRWDSVEEVRAAYRFANLQEFLNLYYEGCKVLVKAEDFYDITRAYLARAHADTVLRAEMFLGPQAHTKRGIAMETVMDGVLGAMRDAEREDGISSGVLIGGQRHLPESEAFAMLEQSMPWAGDIAGFGLGGAELGNPPSKFERFYAECRARGFKVTAHAGEEGPAAYVRESVELLKVDRIDHGNTCMDDPGLVAELAASRVPLTVCPLSNLALQVVPSLDVHPMKAMLDAGLCATMNSDDPSFFGGYVNENYQACVDALGLERQHLVELARNSLDASFVDVSTKATWRRRLDDYVSAAAA